MTGSINTDLVDRLIPLRPLSSETLSERPPRHDEADDDSRSFSSTLNDSIGKASGPRPQSIRRTNLPLSAGPGSVKPEDTLMKAAREFEGYVLGLLLRNMGKQIGRSGLFHSTYQSGFYQDMFFQELANSISTNGRGLGIADVIFNDINMKTSAVNSVGQSELSGENGNE